MRKKVIAILCAATMMMSAVTVFAEPSPVVTGVVTGVTAAKDANGNTIAGIEVKDIPEDNVEMQKALEEIKDIEKLKELLGEEFEEGMQVVDVKDVTVPEGTVFPVTITFKVTGVKPGSKVKVLHYDMKKKKWEVLDTIVGDGTVTVTFNSLSPVAFVVDGKTAEANKGNGGINNIPTTPGTSSTGKTSPKTGETPVGAYAGAVAMIAALGMGVTFYKKKKVE